MSDNQSMSHLKPEETVIQNGEFLDLMFKHQFELVKKYYTPNIDTLTENEKREWTLKLIHAFIDEISELQNQVNFKWWKQPHEVIEKEVKFEIIDLFKFWLTLCLVWGMDPKEVYMYYGAKLKENVRRQENGY